VKNAGYLGTLTLEAVKRSKPDAAVADCLGYGGNINAGCKAFDVDILTQGTLWQWWMELFDLSLRI